MYSFGLVLQELLAGQRLEVKDPTVPRPPVPLPGDVPAELRTLVMKALEDDPADRYQTMRELVVDLRRLVRHPGLDSAAAPTAAGSPRARTRTIGYGIAAFAALLVAAFLGRAPLRDLLVGAPSSGAVAVLPFVNEGTSTDDALISERLGDKLRDRLQELPDIDVIGRVSSLSFRDAQVDMRTIARTLGVGKLVNGSMRRRGSTLDVRVEILNERGFAIRTLSYEEADTALLALQQRISADVGAFFDPASVAPATATTLSAAQGEPANKLILFGSHLEHEIKDDAPYIDEEKLHKAIDYYRRATQAVPGSIEAQSRLAAALLYAGDVEGASEPLRRALELGQSLAAGSKSAELSEAYYTAALYLVGTRNEGADEQYQRALALNPNNVDAIGSYALWLMSHNRSLDAEAYFKTAIRLEPLSLSRYVDYAEYLGIRDETESLRDLAAEIERLFPNERGYLKLARVYELTGDLDVGIAYGLMAYRLLTKESGASVSRGPMLEDARGQLAELYARIGDFEEASRFESEPGIGQLLLRGQYGKLSDVAQDRALDHPEDLETQYFLAFAYNATGDFKNAKYLLEQLNFPLSENTPIGGSESQALSYYIDALQSLGGNEAAVRELASKRVENLTGGTQTGMDRSWWVNTLLACSNAELGRVPEALAALDRVYEARGLALSSLLQDSPCFSKRLASEPRYVALIAHLKDRQQLLRERLPATLQRYGVADVKP